MQDVQQLRLVLTVPDFDAAVRLYRDALGLQQLEDWSDGDAKIVLPEAGAEKVAEPVATPWNDLNVRVRTPDGMQLTVFTALE